MKKVYELWEIMKDGKNGEVFEVVDCVIPNYIGHQLQVYDLQEDAGHFRALIEPNGNHFQDCFEAKLVTLYACLGTSKFKKVSPYLEVSLMEALNLLTVGKSVFVTTATGGMKEITDSTMLKLVDIYTFGDIFHSVFFIKGEVFE